MNRFAALYAELDASTSIAAKVAAMRDHFASVDAADAAWAAYFLAGGKPRQVVPSGLLRALACREAGIDDWLFEECYQAVGDLAETIALVLPSGPHSAKQPSQLGLAAWVEERLLPLRGLSPAEQSERVASYWRELDARGRFLLNKLIGGGFRVGVSRLLVQRALAAHAGLDAKRVAERMMGFTDAKAMPSAERFAALIAPAGGAVEGGQPYPFFLAHALDGDVTTFESRLGPPSGWLVEWKYDGIRAQLVKRGGQVWIWSRGEELVTERFPEVAHAARALADGSVLDGELVVWRDSAPAPFALLQQRIGRKTLNPKVLDATCAPRRCTSAARCSKRRCGAPRCTCRLGSKVPTGRRWPPCAPARANSASKG
jgi:DNA ligase-1